MYSEKLLEEFYNPTNVGVIKGADAVGKIKDKNCGEIFKFYIAVENNTVVDVKFQTYGSTLAIAASSVATKLIMGKTFDEIYSISIDQFKSELGGTIPANKSYVLVLIEEAIHLAIKNYFIKTKGYIPENYKTGIIANSDQLLQENNEDEKEEVVLETKKSLVKSKKNKAKSTLKLNQDLVEDDLDDEDLDDDENKSEEKKETNIKDSKKSIGVYTTDDEDLDEEDQLFGSIDDLTSTLSDELKRLNEENDQK